MLITDFLRNHMVHQSENIALTMGVVPVDVVVLAGRETKWKIIKKSYSKLYYPLFIYCKTQT